MSIFSKEIATYQKLVSHNFVSICPNLAKKSHGVFFITVIKLSLSEWLSTVIDNDYQKLPFAYCNI